MLPSRTDLEISMIMSKEVVAVSVQLGDEGSTKKGGRSIIRTYIRFKHHQVILDGASYLTLRPCTRQLKDDIFKYGAEYDKAMGLDLTKWE